MEVVQIMNKSILVGVALLAGFVISGCANNRELLKNSSHTTRNDVFSEVSSLETESGKAIADIMFAVKSNSSRIAEMTIKHSDPPYRVHVSIDGQTTFLETEPVLEHVSSADSNVPESGTGWKYKFSKRIALAPGKHILTIAIPVDDVIVKQEITLRAGVNTVTVIPVYNKRMLRPYKGQNFTAGVKTLKVMVN
jgi:outer membrane murein-binding lipoprotein Lpp